MISAEPPALEVGGSLSFWVLTPPPCCATLWAMSLRRVLKVRVDEDLSRELDRLANEDDRTLSSLVRQLIGEAIEARKVATK